MAEKLLVEAPEPLKGSATGIAASCGPPIEGGRALNVASLPRTVSPLPIASTGNGRWCPAVVR